MNVGKSKESKDSEEETYDRKRSKYMKLSHQYYVQFSEFLICFCNIQHLIMLHNCLVNKVSTDIFLFKEE